MSELLVSMNGTDIHSCAHITYDVKLAQGWAHKTLTKLYEEDVFPWDGGPNVHASIQGIETPWLKDKTSTPPGSPA